MSRLSRTSPTRLLPVRRALRRGVTVGAAATGVGLGVAAAAVVGAASFALRRLVTPERDRADNVEILTVGDGTITLAPNEDTLLPGRYGLWLDGGQGHARVGDILRVDDDAVERVLLGVDAGDVGPGPARWNGYYHGADPAAALGLPVQDVTLPSEIGDLPAWLVPAEHGDGSAGRWAVLVHGRGATRGECLRAVPVLRSLGYTCLIPTYRNDEGAPASGDRRYALGLAEWRDVDAALEWVRTQGATDVVLGGWSMGGAIVLQTLARSSHADLVSAVLLDGPVVDWQDVITHHVHLGRVPALVARAAPHVLRSRAARRLVGVESPLDVAETDWVGRARELRHRTLVIHSRDDDFVPVGPSEALGRARPELVTFVPWERAAHTKEWNTDPRHWEATVRAFLSA